MLLVTRMENSAELHHLPVAVDCRCEGYHFHVKCAKKMGIMMVHLDLIVTHEGVYGGTKQGGRMGYKL